MTKVHIEVSRVKNLPQGEFDPLPPTSSVLLQPQQHGGIVAPAHFETRRMRHELNPFYNDAVEFTVPPGASQLDLRVTVYDYNKNEQEPRILLFGSATFPTAVSTKSNTMYCIALADTEEAAVPASAADESSDDSPRLLFRYRVTCPPPTVVATDYHADVLLEDEPTMHAAQIIIPEGTQYVWFHLLHDKPWLQQFAATVISTWSQLPKIQLEPRTRSPAGERARSASRPGTVSGRGVPRRAASVSYKSIVDFMTGHWCVRRSHEALTKLRLCAEKFRRGESVAFTVEEELQKKVLWRERQVLLTTTTMTVLEGFTGTDPLRVLFDRLWLNMVFGVPADAADPPPMTFEVRHKLSTVAFSSRHATILRACMLQLLLPGMSYDDATRIAEEDFAPRNIQFVSRRGSQVGGEYMRSEAVMVAFGSPTTPTQPPPTVPVAPLAQIERLLQATQTSYIKPKRSQSRDKAASPRTPSVAISEPEASEDTVHPIKYTAQQVFATVMIEFVGRLVETLTTNEFMLALRAFIPAVTAASEKALMVASGVPPTKRGKRRSVSAAGKKKRSASKTAPPKAGGVRSGPIVIDHLDELGRRRQHPAATGGGQPAEPGAPNVHAIEDEDERDSGAQQSGYDTEAASPDEDEHEAPHTITPSA